jgi:hypothetical protein
LFIFEPEKINKEYLYKMNSIRVKQCSTCGIDFGCGDLSETSTCWCNDFPPLFVPTTTIDCLCPICFKKSCSDKIDEFVIRLTPETALQNKAALLPKSTHLIEGIDYYLENGNYVFKAFFHLKRGYCCTNGCRHCPYGFKK